MRSLYFLSFLLGGASLFSVLDAKGAWAMDATEEALLQDSAQNDKDGEEADYQRRFRQQEEARVREAEQNRKAGAKASKKQSPDVEAYLAAHKGAKTALTPPPTLLGEMGDADPMPTLSPEESQKASQAQLQAQLQNAQHQDHHKAENKSFVLGLDPQQKPSNRYFPSQGSVSTNQNPASSYGHGTAKWKSQLPGMNVDELLGETQGSLIDALELCPPSGEQNASLEMCLKHHSPPEWWTADLKRSEPKLLIEKWKALKTIKLKKADDPLEVYANWLADMIPQEFTDRHHPEFISALVKPKPVEGLHIDEATGSKPAPQPLAPPPLNLAEAKAALQGGLQKPQAIPSLAEEKSLSHQKQEHLAEKKTESYIGDDNAQYLYPVTEAPRHYQPGELRPPAKARRATPPPPVAGVEAYRDEE